MLHAAAGQRRYVIHSKHIKKLTDSNLGERCESYGGFTGLQCIFGVQDYVKELKK